MAGSFWPREWPGLGMQVAKNDLHILRIRNSPSQPDRKGGEAGEKYIYIYVYASVFMSVFLHMCAYICKCNIHMHVYCIYVYT